jgi:hypothetical protein
MPIISFTAGDALQTTTVDAGIYPMEISEIDGPKASKSGNSVNFFVTMRIADGKYAGKEFTICFCSGVSQASVLGGMQFVPQSTFLQIEAAIQNRKVEPVARPDFDTDSLLHQPFDGQIAVSTEDGKLINTITGYLPAGSGKSAPSF